MYLLGLIISFIFHKKMKCYSLFIYKIIYWYVFFFKESNIDAINRINTIDKNCSIYYAVFVTVCVEKISFFAYKMSAKFKVCFVGHHD